MFLLKDLKKCVERCKISGDNPKYYSKFQLAAVMILFSIDLKKKRNEIILINTNISKFKYEDVYLKFFKSIDKFTKLSIILKSFKKRPTIMVGLFMCVVLINN